MLSKDDRFDSSGIGGQTQINYQADLEFYKRYLITAAAGDSGDFIGELFRTWDREVFEIHNKKKGLHNTEDTETIAINDDSELEHDMRMLGLSERHSVEPEVAPPPLEDRNDLAASDEDEFKSFYGKEARPPVSPLPVWAQLDNTHAPNAISDEPQSSQSDLDPVGEHPSASTSLQPGQSASAPHVPVLTEDPEHASTPEASKESATRGRRARARPRGRGSKKV